MKRIKSVVYFHKKPDNLNCAQSILKGFQQEFEISDETIESFRPFGGGRAEGGLCGAIYAANYLMRKKGLESLNEAFVKKAVYEKLPRYKSKIKPAPAKSVSGLQMN